MSEGAVRYPRLPEKGEALALVAPSSPADDLDLDPAVGYLQRMGYGVRLMPSLAWRDRYLAGSDAARGAELNACMTDRQLGGVAAVRGGYGSGRLLDRLDYAGIGLARKLLLGFSDTTAVQLGLLAVARLVSYSGLMVGRDLGGGEPDRVVEESLAAVLDGRVQVLSGLERLGGGGASVRGMLVPGCLSLVVSLVGTPWLPLLEGGILLLEDVGEEPYRVDRMLTQLRHSGVLAGVGAVVFGEFVNCVAKDGRDGSVRQVLESFAGSVDCPVYAGAAYGHGPSRVILPVGGIALLDAGRLTVCGTAGVGI